MAEGGISRRRTRAFSARVVGSVSKLSLKVCNMQVLPPGLCGRPCSRFEFAQPRVDIGTRILDAARARFPIPATPPAAAAGRRARALPVPAHSVAPVPLPRTIDCYHVGAIGARDFWRGHFSTASDDMLTHSPFFVRLPFSCKMLPSAQALKSSKLPTLLTFQKT